jgi:hypothetical protein
LVELVSVPETVESMVVVEFLFASLFELLVDMSALELVEIVELVFEALF